MLIISDTNILSSFAAADALSLLTELFSDYTLHIPPAVEKELEEEFNLGISMDDLNRRLTMRISSMINSS